MKLKQINNMYEPYVHIDSSFERKDKSLHQLYKESYKRKIQVSKESLLFLNLEESLEMIQALIKEHILETKGDLGIFGEVTYYYYRHCDGNIFGFDKYGERL